MFQGPSKLGREQEQYIHPWIVRIYRKLEALNEPSISTTSDFHEKKLDSRGPVIILNQMEMKGTGSSDIRQFKNSPHHDAYDNPGFVPS